MVKRTGKKKRKNLTGILHSIYGRVIVKKQGFMMTPCLLYIHIYLLFHAFKAA